MKRKYSLGYVILFIVLLIASLMMVMPYVWMVLSSLKPNIEIMASSPTLLPENPTLTGYKTVIEQAPFFTWLINSSWTSVVITAGTLFTSALAGYIFAKFQFFGKRVLFVVILASMMVPFAVVMIPSYLIISRLGLINNLSAIVIPSLISAFGIFLCRQFIDAIPGEMIEASRIDGAGEYRTFWSIIVPQIKPVMSALGIFTFMGAWNNYIWPLIVLNDLNKMTVPLALVFFNSQHGVNWNIVMSAAVLIMIPVVIVFLLFQKQFVKGLTLTGIK